ncbi:NAD-dependent epimerase/dehydratase family protein [Aquibacillus albus]|uniref:UDP-glucose 4-epimerase n=1 Tax=Aquibacillus albus TaxID=1168171 RepID=A0ABS2N3K5_9BACI|nr:UDP-glucose 4-epimerase [Aquibacillus albus]
MAILVTGGAGYIGSHTVLFLQEQGEHDIVLDSLQKGHPEALHGAAFYEGTLQDSEVLDEILTNQRYSHSDTPEFVEKDGESSVEKILREFFYWYNRIN